VSDLRVIPSIEQLRQRAAMQALEARYGRGATVEALRAETSALREQLASGTVAAVMVAEAIERIEAGTARRLRASIRPSLVRVINATGVIIHTNLGRAPLADAAMTRVAEVAGGYTNLEYDLAAGARGRRDAHAAHLLTRLTGADAAVVVNNNAAATLLMLAALAGGREVIISRGELVEIGGGFRVPDVMTQSGAILREVGTTNRTRAADYAAAISERTALILRVHPSNFTMHGFTERASIEELVSVGRRFGIPVAEDLGSGWLGWPDREELPAGLRGEPIVSDSLAAGVSVVSFSGDKLLGGPQAGIIAGAREAIDVVRRHPLMRALRVDKLTYAALEATLEEHAIGRGREAVPALRMIGLTADAVAARAGAVADALGARGWRTSLRAGHSTIGGGSAPGSSLPTTLLVLERDGASPDEIDAWLRSLEPPVVARIETDQVVLDLRTVDPADDQTIVRLLTAI
jgi:L-seryl-tRNA(Ser) seleniumtransferase